MRLGVISDIHGVAQALAEVLTDGDRVGVDRWWALGDLVLFGPGPSEVLEMLDSLHDVSYVRGNTDRYVLSDDQPHPHATPEAAARDVDLVRRYGLMAAGAAWTRGVLDQAGTLELLDSLPDKQHTTLPDGTRLLGVHASPGSDDGPGGLPRTPGTASWMLITADDSGAAVEHRSVPFDTDAVIDDLNRRRHPNREFISSAVASGSMRRADR